MQFFGKGFRSKYSIVDLQRGLFFLGAEGFEKDNKLFMFIIIYSCCGSTQVVYVGGDHIAYCCRLCARRCSSRCVIGLQQGLKFVVEHVVCIAIILILKMFWYCVGLSLSGRIR